MVAKRRQVLRRRRFEAVFGLRAHRERGDRRAALAQRQVVDSVARRGEGGYLPADGITSFRSQRGEPSVEPALGDRQPGVTLQQYGGRPDACRAEQSDVLGVEEHRHTGLSGRPRPEFGEQSGDRAGRRPWSGPQQLRLVAHHAGRREGRLPRASAATDWPAGRSSRTANPNGLPRRTAEPRPRRGCCRRRRRPRRPPLDARWRRNRASSRWSRSCGPPVRPMWPARWW